VPAPVADLSDEAMQETLEWNFWHTFWTMRGRPPSCPLGRWWRRPLPHLGFSKRRNEET
jgi:hypothetical protein